MKKFISLIMCAIILATSMCFASCGETEKTEPVKNKIELTESNIGEFFDIQVFVADNNPSDGRAKLKVWGTRTEKGKKHSFENVTISFEASGGVYVKSREVLGKQYYNKYYFKDYVKAGILNGILFGEEEFELGDSIAVVSKDSIGNTFSVNHKITSVKGYAIGD